LGGTELLRFSRRNLPRRYFLYVHLRGEDEPVLAGVRYSVGDLLRLLHDWEEEEDFESAYLEIES
jgi:hypothetical protein